jgi:hypothetical protein
MEGIQILRLSNVQSWMKIVQTDGDEVAQHGTLELLILESSNRHRTWLIASKSSERALGKEKSRPRRLLISKLKIADGSATEPGA